MALAELNADILTAAFDPAVFGEPVLRAGAAPLIGIFYPHDSAGGTADSEVGLTCTIGSQMNPSVDLRDADAVGLAINDPLIIRETVYLITRLNPTGNGLTRCDLMPATAGDSDPLARYR
jgi:hypothetical protein